MHCQQTGTQQVIRRLGVLNTNNSYSIENLNNTKVNVSIVELRNLKTAAEDLVAEIKAHTPGLITDARNAADSAIREHGAAVSSSASSVKAQCNVLSSASAEAIAELETNVNGLDKAIKDYVKTEQELFDIGSN